MNHKLKMTLIAALSATTLHAADWSDTAVGYRYAPSQSEPGVSDKVAKNILSFTHVSGDKLGTNFFTIDLLKSNGADKNMGDSAGAQEWYGFYKRSFSLAAMTGAKGFGFAKDINLTARVDAGAKNTEFAPAPRKLRLGASVAMPVSAGFWDIGLEAYRESNHNGIVHKEVQFKTVPALSSAWAIPVAGGTFGGFLDVVAPKGKDGFGDETKTEVLLRATYMVDVLNPKAGLKAGVGLEHWGNKFGCNNSLSGVKNSCKASTPLLLVEYHL